MAYCPIVEPPWTVDLPRLVRDCGGTSDCPPYSRPDYQLQLPKPALDGDWVRGWALALRGRCSQCGCQMRPPFYVVWYEVPNREPGNPFEEHPGGVLRAGFLARCINRAPYMPAHVCPYLKYKSSRLQFYKWPGSETENRGDAAILGFNRYGIAYYTEAPPCNGRKHRYSFGYYAQAERTPYDSFRDLLPLYEAAIAADAKVIDTSTRLYWTESAADLQRLKACEKQDNYTIASKKAGALINVNGHMYRLALL